MKEVKKQLGKQFTRALFDLSSIDTKARTVDVVFATETPVLKQTWDGPVNEILVCDAASVRMDRINSGAPLLDTHDKYSVTTQLGVVENARIEGRQLKATVRFSKREDAEKVWQDVVDGILRNISVGYRVYEYEITEKVTESIADYRATDWEPFEISLVPVPADFNSGVRSADAADNNDVKITNKKNNNNMKIAAQILAAVRSAGLPADFAETLLQDENVTMESARAAIDAEVVKVKNTTPPAPAAPVAEPTRAQSSPKVAGEILHAVRSAGLGLEFASGLLETENITLDGARAAIIAELGKNQSQANTRGASTAAVVPGKDATDKRRSGMEKAILHRVNPGAVPAVEAGEYRGMSLIDLAKECLTAAGENVRGMTSREVAMEAFGLGSRTLSSSDFPLILGNTINRSLRQAYDLEQRTFMPFCRQGNAKDFRTKSITQLSDFASLDAVVEGAEYKMGNLSESAESYKVAKYGKIIPITWETLVNDDLGAFGRIPQAMAAAAAQKQSDIVYAILTANAAMADSVALFHATHGNLTGTGTAISVASLGVARAAMRKQTAPKGSAMNLAPKFLVTGPDQEALALQYTSQNYVATKNSDINVWAGLLTPIIDSRLTGTQWYLMAAPTNIDTIEYAFLDGEELFTENKIGFEIDGMQTKVRMVFGAKAIDYRGMYKNAGA